MRGILLIVPHPFTITLLLSKDPPDLNHGVCVALRGERGGGGASCRPLWWSSSTRKCLGKSPLVGLSRLGRGQIKLKGWSFGQSQSTASTAVCSRPVQASWHWNYDVRLAFSCVKGPGQVSDNCRGLQVSSLLVFLLQLLFQLVYCPIM